MYKHPRLAGVQTAKHGQGEAYAASCSPKWAMAQSLPPGIFWGHQQDALMEQSPPDMRPQSAPAGLLANLSCLAAVTCEADLGLSTLSEHGDELLHVARPAKTFMPSYASSCVTDEHSPLMEATAWL